MQENHYLLSGNTEIKQPNIHICPYNSPLFVYLEFTNSNIFSSKLEIFIEVQIGSCIIMTEHNDSFNQNVGIVLNSSARVHSEHNKLKRKTFKTII